MSQIPPPPILCLQVNILIIHWHCLQVSYTSAQTLVKKLICIEKAPPQQN